MRKEKNVNQKAYSGSGISSRSTCAGGTSSRGTYPRADSSRGTYDRGSSRAEDIWAAIETILYSSGRKLHFKKRGDLPEIRAKQSTRGLVIDSSQSGLIVKYGKITIPCKYKAKDLWLWDEEKAILAYLAEPELQDAHAVDQMSKGIITDTYRPCFASLVCKKIRGRLRVYVHITVEGKAISKRRINTGSYHSSSKYNNNCCRNNS